MNHRSIRPTFVLLSQDVAFENLACLAMQLREEEIQLDFIWPFIEGPIQGSATNAIKMLKRFNPSLKLRTFNSKRKWEAFVNKLIDQRAVIFAQTPYVKDHYSIESQDLLEQTETAYVNYGVNLSHDHYCYDLESYADFSAIFVANNYEYQRFRQNNIPEKQLLISGIPALFQIHKSQSKLIESRKLSNFPQVMWAPHWTGEWSTLENSVSEILGFFSENSDIKLLIRPHPLLGAITGKILPPGYQGTNEVSDYVINQFSQLVALKNVQISSSTLAEDCVNSDSLITDGISIIAFFAATGKPIAITRKHNSPDFSHQFNQFSKHVDFLDTNKKGTITSWLEKQSKIEKLPFSRPKFNQELFEASSEFFEPERSPGQIAAEWIKKF